MQERFRVGWFQIGSTGLSHVKLYKWWWKKCVDITPESLSEMFFKELELGEFSLFSFFFNFPSLTVKLMFSIPMLYYIYNVWPIFNILHEKDIWRKKKRKEKKKKRKEKKKKTLSTKTKEQLGR